MPSTAVRSQSLDEVLIYNRHKKDKPWDTDDIDKWKIEPFKPSDNAGGHFAEESSFATLFPKYREVYLKESWPLVTKLLKDIGIASATTHPGAQWNDPESAVRRVVEDCMANIHPIYQIKELMVKRELAKDPELAHESWDRFLPNYKKRSLSRRRVPFKVTDKAKKAYTPFPPAPEQSKVDKQLEAGEYHIGREAKKRIAQEERIEKQKVKKEEKKRERERDFVAPDEPGTTERKKKKQKTKATED
ncbi:hypothetical protein DL768_007989 [Monosporascus sp. mg162]|nr:hypothetical protein DL768_007989 [Monosporascus sp. mg162]